ncbi:hypothetical protein BGZ73_000533 [Actinomortierella ambigua]|nr:hypothetical protein BGZ73_000533 [Actinomortierella ambigua]
MSTKSTPQIAIVGGGVAGLTLARVMQVHGIRSTLFELDTAAQSRDQGGTLDLDLESGQAALHSAGLFAQFQTYIRDDGQEVRLADKHGKIHLHDQSAEATVRRPEIDRGSLRQILVDSVDAATIQWGTHVQDIRPSQSDPSKYTIVYNGNHEATFDLVVGADGAWSKVRKLLSDALPIYSGLSFLEFRIRELRARHPPLFAMVGPGSYFAMGDDGKNFVAQLNADRTLRVYAVVPLQETEFSALNSLIADPDRARQYLFDVFHEWGDGYKDLIRASDDYFVSRPIYALPVPHVWENKPGLTLVGDAAHLMSPYAGAGANMAMWGGAELGQRIADAIKTGKRLSQAVADYEQAMYAMTRPAAERSASNLERFTASDSVEQVVEFFRNRIPREE